MLQFFATDCNVMRMGYGEDSFFTLGWGGRIGVVAISLILLGLCLWVCYAATGGLGRVWRVLIALAVFWLFVWLSPQVYYMFYLLIFDGLPLQWVIGAPPGADAVLRLMTFTERVTLSEHGKGVMGWAMVMAALLRRRVKVD